MDTTYCICIPPAALSNSVNSVLNRSGKLKHKESRNPISNSIYASLLQSDAHYCSCHVFQPTQPQHGVKIPQQYGKMPAPPAARAKKKLPVTAATFVSHSVLLLLLLVLNDCEKASAAPDNGHREQRVLAEDGNNNASSTNLLDAAAVARHCAGTLHHDVCTSTLASIPNLAQKPLRDVISEVLGRAAAAVRASSSNCSSYMRRPRGLRVRDRLALSDCVELFGGTLRLLGAAAAELSAACDSRTAEESVAGVRTALSAALTNQYTCLDGFAGPSASEDGRVRPFVQGRIYHVAHLVSNSLAMLRRLPSQRRHRGLREEEKEAVLEGYGRVRRGFPAWVSAGDRRRLQQAAGVAANAVVAKDGTGDFTTVSEAVAAAPNNSEARYVIYIKAGGYLENVEVGSDKTNLMFVGDGMWKTVIKASRNFVDNSTTFRSATLGAFFSRIQLVILPPADCQFCGEKTFSSAHCSINSCLDRAKKIT
jgi:pectinesterase